MKINYAAADGNITEISLSMGTIFGLGKLREASDYFEDNFMDYYTITSRIT